MKSLIKFCIIKVIGFIIYLTNKYLSLIAYYQKNNFAQIGENVWVGHYCTFTLNHIYCGSNVSIGSRASFIASIANIYR